ncbi:hypothetical protein KW797_01410 [Candidatus Parcubacteria bacterium]|nr:hypothetical protein [Candidatus Parcubacteria bacterium]
MIYVDRCTICKKLSCKFIRCPDCGKHLTPCMLEVHGCMETKSKTPPKAPTKTKRPSIKFSHHYAKLRAVEPEMAATLLDVLIVRIETLSPAFLDYDTDDGMFKLPKKGEFMMLMFEGSRGLLTTLRSSWRQSKVAYYQKLIGQDFDIVIAPPEE